MAGYMLTEGSARSTGFAQVEKQPFKFIRAAIIKLSLDIISAIKASTV